MADEIIHQDTNTARELILTIWPREFVQWEGSAAQLIAEGLIPENIEWPERRSSMYWDGDGFDYWLRRTRPPGIKGPMSIWLHGDYWMLRRSLTSGDKSYSAAQIHRARLAYEQALWRKTTAYQIQCDRAWTARSDKRFQAFLNNAKAV